MTAASPTPAATHGAAADTPPRLFVIGPGRAGLGVAAAAAAAGIAVVGVLGRRARDAGVGGPRVDPLGADGAYPAAIVRATVVFVAVQDRELDDALAPLAAAELTTGTAVLQASGSIEPAAFAGLRARGIPCGTFHPLVPLAAPERAADLLRGAWIGVDGDGPAVAAARSLAAALGANVLTIPPGERARYHAAAVFASNFPVVLAAVAERLLADAGVPGPAAGAAVRHLLASAATNLAAGDDVAAALTGPIARGDAATVARHLAALATDPEADALYRALGRATLRVAAGAPTDRAGPAARAAIATLLG